MSKLNENQLDEILQKLVDVMDIVTSKAIQSKTMDKETAEAACLVLSVAYERCRSYVK